MQPMAEGDYEAKQLRKIEPNTEEHMKLEAEMKERGEDARMRSEFHAREARLLGSVADACDAALESLNNPKVQLAGSARAIGSTTLR